MKVKFIAGFYRAALYGAYAHSLVQLEKRAKKNPRRDKREEDICLMWKCIAGGRTLSEKVKDECPRGGLFLGFLGLQGHGGWWMSVSQCRNWVSSEAGKGPESVSGDRGFQYRRGCRVGWARRLASIESLRESGRWQKRCSFIQPLWLRLTSICSIMPTSPL